MSLCDGFLSDAPVHYCVSVCTSLILCCVGALQEQIVLHFVLCWAIQEQDILHFVLFWALQEQLVCLLLSAVLCNKRIVCIYPLFLGITGTVCMTFTLRSSGYYRNS